MISTIKSYVEDAKNGIRDSLDIYKVLNELSNTIDSAKKEVLELALDEFEKYGEKQISYKGYLVSKVQSARYDYSNISAWNSAKENIKKIEDLAKMAEKQGDAIILETGEIIEPAIKKYNSPSLSFKQNKLKGDLF